MQDFKLNILIVGLGGQGVIFASEIIAQIFIDKGLIVKKSEIHGLAQRGGSVISHLRVGKQIFSPVIPNGKIDFLLAIDSEEAEMWKDNLKKKGIYLEGDESVNKKFTNIVLVSKLFSLLKKNFLTKNKIIIENKDIVDKLHKKINNKDILIQNIEIVNFFFRE